VPVWHEGTAKWVKDGKLVLLGVIQEQHADRCRLLAQWKGFRWPILHDPINVLEATGVPILTARRARHRSLDSASAGHLPGRLPR
jgi:hypothetical protein